ncbi:hypothetical protein [Brevibacterium sp. UCMA 11754]|nr:hypothetical protein [Brevibacterium sp. UCMA 11754]MCF2571554.1 hypothetical protein [Brevibacterium sp. UCMA 11754]
MACALGSCASFVHGVRARSMSRAADPELGHRDEGAQLPRVHAMATA